MAVWFSYLGTREFSLLFDDRIALTRFLEFTAEIGTPSRRNLGMDL
jgi:hypothetical protein